MIHYRIGEMLAQIKAENKRELIILLKKDFTWTVINTQLLFLALWNYMSLCEVSILQQSYSPKHKNNNQQSVNI